MENERIFQHRGNVYNYDGDVLTRTHQTGAPHKSVRTNSTHHHTNITHKRTYTSFIASTYTLMHEHLKMKVSNV